MAPDAKELVAKRSLVGQDIETSIKANLKTAIYRCTNRNLDSLARLDVWQQWLAALTRARACVVCDGQAD